MGIGEFRLNGRRLSALPIFGHVYKVGAWTPEVVKDLDFILNEVAFVHFCQTWTPAGYYINENGYCTQCGKFLASHKKLEVMMALKELNK